LRSAVPPSPIRKVTPLVVSEVKTMLAVLLSTRVIETLA
jgi:hypothetical protein